MATLAQAAKPDLTGWGTFLGRNVNDGERFGGQGIDDFLKKLQAYDPNARIVDDQGAENGHTQRIEYDNTLLPQSGGHIGHDVELNKGYGDQGNDARKADLYPGADRAMHNDSVYGQSVNSQYEKVRGDHLLDIIGPLAVSLATMGAGFLPGAAASAGASGGMTGGQALGLFKGIGGGLMKGDWKQALMSLGSYGAGELGIDPRAISLGRAALGYLGKNQGGGH